MWGALLFLAGFPMSIVWGIICLNIAFEKGRSGVAWFFIGFFLRLIGLVMICCFEKLSESEEKGFSCVADEIKKLNDLRAAGILTEEEFNRKKRQLLGK